MISDREPVPMVDRADVRDPPRGRPKNSKNIPWDQVVAKVRKYPGVWMLLPEMRYVSARHVITIRRRERRALRLEDGVIRAQRRTTVWLEDGTVRCDIILKFVAKKGEPDGSEVQRRQSKAVPPDRD